jgi:glycoprotein-N-acetylgalactosamine 3-beta-galactosyltransferase
MPENHAYKATSINSTWGKRCDKLIYISTDDYEGLDIVKVNVTEDRNNLWGKTKKALDYIYRTHLNEYDWFLKADDDTFVIVENLKYLLYSYSADMPIYFGCKLKPFVKQVSFLQLRHNRKKNRD